MLSFQLYQLQQVDSERTAIKKRIAELEGLLADRSAVSAAEQAFQEAKAAHRSAQRALQEAEANSQAVRAKIARSEKALYGGRIHNPRELQALQDEVAMLKRRLEQLEDAQLEAMLTVEEAEEALKAAEERLAAVKSERSTQESLWNGEIVELREKLSRLDSRRAALAASIPPEALKTYEDLRSKRGGQAVAGVTDGACNACGAPLPPPVLQAARSPDSLAFCPTCGRILYIL